MHKYTLFIFLLFLKSYLLIAQTVKYVESNETFIRLIPDINADIVGELNGGDSVIVVSDSLNGWAEIRISEKNFYVRSVFLVDTKFEISKSLIQNSLPNYESTRTGSSGSAYRPTGTRESRSNSNDRIIYTGPRGGRYYINSKGNKIYVK